TDLNQVENGVQPNTKLIYVETPSNPLFKVTDIDGVGQIARRNDALLAVDNTFMTPLGQTPLKLGADIVVDRKSTRLNSSHVSISYAVFCLKKKMKSRMIY